MTKRVQIAEMKVGNLRAVLEQIQPEMRYEVKVYWDGMQTFRIGPTDYPTATKAMNDMFSGSLRRLTCAEADSARRDQEGRHAA